MSKKRKSSKVSRRKASVAKRRSPGRNTSRWTFNPLYYFVPIAAVIVGVGTWKAYGFKWHGDDIFITLRYAENWLNGNGLVYNIGERVEGYTHFIWLLFITFFQSLGLDPVSVSENLGILSYFFTLLIISLISYRLQVKKTILIIPFALIMLVFHEHFKQWSSGGLETMFFTMLLSMLVFVTYFLDIRKNLKLIFLGGLMFFLITSRPDGAIFVILTNLFFLIYYLIQKQSWKQLIKDGLLLNSSLILIYLPYLIWKIGYYGDIFPNTYYAKAAYLNSWKQGMIYLNFYFKVYVTSLFWVPLWLIYNILRLRGGSTLRQLLTEDHHFKAINTIAVTILVYTFGFIVKVGGGFMYPRFFIPLVPLFYILVEMTAIEIPRILKAKSRKRYSTLIILGSTLIGLSLLNYQKASFEEILTQKDQQGNIVWKKTDYIIDERLFYKPMIARLEGWGSYLAPFFEDLDVTVLNSGQCAFTYYGKFKTVIESFGLTDKFIARQKVAQVGRVGHSTSGNLEYYTQREVNFVFYRSPYKKDLKYRFCTFLLPNNTRLGAEMFVYDKPLIQELSRRMGTAFQFTNFEQYCDLVINSQLPTMEPEAIRSLYEEFDIFYFSQNDDQKTNAQEADFRKYLDDQK